MREKYILRVDELERVVQDLLEEMQSGVVILRGDLAAGKTTFVKKVAEMMGIKEDVTSPTFSLQQCYGSGLFHYDIYNHGVEHFLSLGMLEELEKEGLHFIEWGDTTLIELLSNAGIDLITIDIEKIDNSQREYRVCIH